jgi:hypothetical protein
MEMANAWADMAGRAVMSLRGMVQAFKGGDILGGIEQIIGLIGSVLGGLTQMGVLKIPAGTSGWGGGMSYSGYTGFSTYGKFKVGGSGGVDSKLVQFRATPGEMVNVTRGEQDNNPRAFSPHFDLRGAVMTADLLAQMNAMAADAAQRGAVGGANLAAYNSVRGRRKSLPA